MEFEWSQAKSDATERLRGFNFAFAVEVFSSPTLEWCDSRQAYDEVRIIAIGRAGPLHLVVVYTDRGPARRIISARPANRKERRLWLETFAPTPSG
ncbi:hypothetical protein STVA_23430 [Allostella vacuolata]|nr:hypothetical protein STVA_23430 [Stella vacuolata]